MFIVFIVIKFISLDHQRLSDMHTKKKTTFVGGMQRQRAVKKWRRPHVKSSCCGWCIFSDEQCFCTLQCFYVSGSVNVFAALWTVHSCYSNPRRRGAHRFPRVNSTFYGWAVISAWPVFLLQPTVWKICMSFICKATELRANGVLSGLSLWVI